MAYTSTYSRRSKRFPLGIIIAVVIAAVAVILLSTTSLPERASAFFEQEPPHITVQMPPGFGVETQTILVSVQDHGAGLSEITVFAEQGEKRVELLKRPLEKAKDIEIPIELNAKAAGFRDGAIAIRVSAVDDSYAGNKAEQSAESRVLLSRPQVETLTTQHNVAQGGVGLVVYRIAAGHISQSGIKVGPREFRGYPIEAFGGTASPGIHAALFSVPKNFDDSKESLSVFARDVAGNVATAAVNHRILKKKFSEVPMKASEPFLRRKMPLLLPGYAELSGKEVPALGDNPAKPELVAAFRTINEEYRALLDKKLAEILSSSAPLRLWQGPFVRPVAGSPTSGFGERRVYTSDGAPAGGSIHDGVDLAAVANVEVRPAQHGKVIFTGDLGIYGSTVLIDHGLGLSTLYGHLSSITVGDGQSVSPETILGRSGSTGLAGGDHLHFEVRLWNTPVSPFEWWDPKWNKNHIDDKVRAAS